MPTHAELETGQPPTGIRSARGRLAVVGVLAALALVFVAPFVWTVHRYPLTSLDSELVAATCLAFGLICCAWLERSTPEIRWPLPAVLLLFAVISSAQQLTGMLAYPQQASRFALFLFAMLAAYLLGRLVVAAGRARDAIGVLCGAVLAGALFSVFVQWLQMLDAELLPSWLALVHRGDDLQRRPYGNLAQPNQLATYLAMGAISALYLAERTKRFTLAAASLCALGCGLALTGSRMAAVFVLVAVAAAIAPTALRPASVRARWIAAAALVGGYTSGLITLRVAVGDFDTLTRFAQGSLALRLELWRQAAEIAAQHPWFGVGIGQFGSAQYWVARSGPYVVPANNCHNLALQLAAELGWPAALGAIALVIDWGARDLRARLARPEHAAALAMMLMIALHSLLEFPLWHLYFAIAAALLFALAEPGPGAPLARVYPRPLLAVAGVLMVAVAQTYQWSYEGVAKAAAPWGLEALGVRKPTDADAGAVLSVADSGLFQPEVDRMLIDLPHPPDLGTPGTLFRSSRVLSLLPAPEVIAEHVYLLAQVGLIDDAVLHVARLKVFAGDDYEVYRDWLLNVTRNIGPRAAPLRNALRRPR